MSAIKFPEQVDGVPPVVSLREYDDAEWAKETAIDFNKDKGVYVAVNMADQSHIIAQISEKDKATLDDIFHSAKEQYVTENVKPK